MREKMKLNEDKFSEEIWLKYFNNVLFDKGMITKEQRDKIELLIIKKTKSKKINPVFK